MAFNAQASEVADIFSTRLYCSNKPPMTHGKGTQDLNFQSTSGEGQQAHPGLWSQTWGWSPVQLS